MKRLFLFLTLTLLCTVNYPAQNLILFDSGGGDRPYKVYTALLTQTGTDAPVATVLENTIGNIVWSRNNAGIFIASISGGFTEHKWFFMGGTGVENEETGLPYTIYANQVNADIQITVMTPDGIARDQALSYTPIEIRVYP